MIQNHEVVIVGAGVLGVTLAYHLSHLKIPCLVLEREKMPAQHASGRNAGMFRQLYRHPALSAWARRSRERWPAEIHETFFRKRGSLILDRECPEHEKDLFSAAKFSYPHESDVRSCVYTETDGLLDSPGYVAHLRARADLRYARYRFSSEISRIDVSGSGRFRIELKGGETLSGSRLVNTAGAWINTFLTGDLSPYRLQTKAFSRHLFLVEGWPRHFMPAADCGYFWDESSHWYMREWDAKSRLVSICDMQETKRPDAYVPDPDINVRLGETLLKRLPDVAKSLCVARSWNCFRTYTEDLLPVFGEQPELPALFWLSAFGGFGMSTSFGACEEAALHLAGRIKSARADFDPTRVQSPDFKRLSAQG